MWSSCNIYRALIHRWQVFFSAHTPTPQVRGFSFFFNCFFPFLCHLNFRESQLHWNICQVGRVGVQGVLRGVAFLLFCLPIPSSSHTSSLLPRFSPGLSGVGEGQAGLNRDCLGICLGTKCNVYHASSSVDTVQEPKSIEWPGWASQPSPGGTDDTEGINTNTFFNRWLLIGNLPGIWASLFKTWSLLLSEEFVCHYSFVYLFVYSPGRLKYSILCAITAEHCRVPGNIKRACRAAWCEPCQDKQTWHIKQENETLLLSPQK